MNPKRKAYVIMTGVFFAGVAVGAGASLAATQRHFAKLVGEPDRAAMRERHLEGLTRRLDLSEAQRDQIRAIMDKHGDAYTKAMRDMFSRCGEKMRAERSKIDSEIALVLDEAQRRDFEKLNEERRHRFFGTPAR